jgi:hypothetical protein
MLWRFPLDEGTPKAVGITGTRAPAIRPDGKAIAFAKTEVDAEHGLWRLDNFLPPATGGK